MPRFSPSRLSLSRLSLSRLFLSRLSASSLAVLFFSALILSALASPPISSAQTLTVSSLHDFCTTKNCPDGIGPNGSLVLASDGNFYGVATDGGAYGAGTLFRITPAGSFTTLYSFCSAETQTCPDGAIPLALIQSGDGNLYGVTARGGTNSGGTLFRFTPSATAGTLTTLYTFCSAGGAQCSDGALPFSLIVGSNGSLYGVTQHYGGAFGSSEEGGTLFEFAPSADSGTITILNHFCTVTDCTDGSIPQGILEGSDKNFYGAFEQGGSSARFGSSGVGGVFKLLSPALTYTVLYNFCATVNNKADCIDGGDPYANIIEAQDGSLYGTLSVTPTASTGIIYRMTTAGVYTALYTFAGTSDGSDPQQPFTYATDGNYYGSNALDGDGYGTFFNFSVSGTVASLNTYYAPKNDTSTPADASGPILQGSDGNFYGVTASGGTGAGFGGGAGTVYKVTASPALPPPVALTLSSPSAPVNSTVTLTWTVANAFSLTAQQCYAFVQNKASGAGTWTGLQPVTYDSKTMTYGGSAKITPTAAGNFTYALTCGGVESGFATLKVGKSSATALTATPASVSVGQSTTLKATVTGTTPVPTGSVTFSTAGVALATVNLNGSGVASLTASTNGEPPATYPIIATYSGDSGYISSVSPIVNITVAKAPTTTALTAAPASVTPPASVTLTATVVRSASSTSGTPTGSVTFSTGGLALATVKLNAKGVAALTASSQGYPAGKYPLLAKYLGDASDSASTSSSVTVTVK
jgi:uncharacterized repeat protein (TIGR03803 family)